LDTPSYLVQEKDSFTFYLDACSQLTVLGGCLHCTSNLLDSTGDCSCIWL